MALRKTTHLVVFSLLVLLTSGTLLRAQGKLENPRSDRTIDLNLPADPGSRPVDLHSTSQRSTTMSMAPAAGEFPPPKYKTSGREFYLAFPSIVGNDPAANDPAKRSIYLSARSRTRVKIKFLKRPWEIDTVTVPGQITVVEVPDWGVLRQTQFENVYDLGILVTAEDDIVVYGYSHEGKSSDGWLVLPKEALGQHYVVASQRNSLNYPVGWFDAFRPRSAMVIAATEDNTLITFKLTALSQTRRLQKDSIYTINLNRGELFPIMARDSGFYKDYSWSYVDDNGVATSGIDRIFDRIDPTGDPDLTGSEVWSDKPIALFSGHERAATPDAWEIDVSRNIYTSATGISRDHLTEQMPPVELWGNEFYVMSSFDRGDTRPTGGDIVRVISAYDNTVVSLNGVAVSVVNAGKYYQFMSGEIAHIQTSQPALVVKYMLSMKDFVEGSLGDPDMTIVPPVCNLSTAYTLPVVNNNLVFREYFVNVLVHDDGLKSLRINGKAPQSRAKKITGTDYTWFSEWGAPGEWRIECDLPCYAESYAYGNADSYTFAGGGDFKYHDSLSAENLDFKTLLIGRTKGMTANVKAGLDLNLLVDSISIYGITWISGDTTYFGMLDTLQGVVKMGPGDELPVRFEFRPTEVRRYEAKAWVWSSSRSLVYINVVGYGGLMTVEITPKDIDFGRVRVGTEVSAPFNVLFGGDDNLARVHLYSSTYPELNSAKLGFAIPDVLESDWQANTAYTSAVKFKPMTEGYRDSGFSVNGFLPQTPDVTEKLHVRLRGRGVQPNVITQDLDFGEIRIGRESPYREIEIRNIGSDTTKIVKVDLESGDIDDFTLESVSLPNNFVLDTTDVVGSRYRFRAKFNPNDTGMKSVNVKITTLEQVIYSKLTGRGVEPYVIATPPVVDFGTIDGSLPVVNPTKVFTIQNVGTYEAILNKLQQTPEGKKHFVLRPLNALETVADDPLAKNGSLQVEVTFLVDAVGDYSDIVSIFNDTRNKPLVELRARVTTDLVITPPKLNFDTIRNCDPVELEITIHNPNSVGVVLDTIFFTGDNNGFSFGGNTVFIPDSIKIGPGQEFTFYVKYEFPKELLSGQQKAKLVIYQLTGDELVRLEIDLEVYRSIRTLSLLTVKPAYTPNVSDAQPFLLPITIQGDHEGLTELDNFKLVLRFDNDLFKPVGVYRPGSLTENLVPGDGQVFADPYDPVTRTYTIYGRDLQVSQRKGDRLLSVLVQALLTVDKTATVTPELNLNERPCAYAIEKQGVLLEYADDCGDELLREMLREEVGFKILSANPNPLVLSASNSIDFRYALRYPALLECEVLNMSGAVVAKLEPVQAQAGEGTLNVPGSLLPATGMYVLRITEQPAEMGTAAKAVHSQTFRVIR